MKIHCVSGYTLAAGANQSFININMITGTFVDEGLRKEQLIIDFSIFAKT